jgi:hypothetical protein
MNIYIILLILVVIIFLGFGYKMNKQHFQNPQQSYRYLGCFKDNSSNLALPNYKGEVSNVDECATIARNNNAKYFGLKNVKSLTSNGDLSNKPMCFISNSDETDYNKYGESQMCLNFENKVYGKGNTNSVYQVLSQQDIDEQEALKKKLAQNAVILAQGGSVIDSCAFEPTKIQGGFGTVLACKDYCRNIDNNGAFGGPLCNESTCEKICLECDNNQFCKWLSEPVFKEEKTPKQISLEYTINGSEVALLWEKPESSFPISHYSIVITQMDDSDKLEIETNLDVNSDFVEHIVRGLNPKKIYFIEVYARNSFGYGMPSNKIEVQVYYTSSNGYKSATEPENDEETMKSFINELKGILASQKSNKSTEYDINSPLDILKADRERDATLQKTYNLNLFFKGA